jgi:hypothetical protein
MRNVFRYLLLALSLCSSAFAQTTQAVTAVKPEAILGAGDIVKINV